MFCKNCGAQLQPGNPTCLNCGVSVGQGNSYCANCGQQVVPGQAVCTNCGFSLDTQAPAQNSAYLNGQDKVVMILICLFLGGFGIHNFMMGENKKGIFKIVMTFCCGIGGILALIDLVRIAMGSYVVDSTKLV